MDGWWTVVPYPPGVFRRDPHHSSTLFFLFSFFSFSQHFTITFSYYTLTHTPPSYNNPESCTPVLFLSAAVLSLWLPLLTAKWGKRAEVPLGLLFSQSPISFIGRTGEEESRTNTGVCNPSHLLQLQKEKRAGNKEPSSPLAYISCVMDFAICPCTSNLMAA